MHKIIYIYIYIYIKKNVNTDWAAQRTHHSEEMVIGPISSMRRYRQQGLCFSARAERDMMSAAGGTVGRR